MSTLLLTLAGLVIIAVVLLDAFLTILSTSAAGPMTRAWSRPLWSGLLVLHRRRRVHALLGLAGPAMVLVTILVWYAGLVAGTWLVFSAHPGAVVSNSSGAAADRSTVFYFVPTTLSGLGYGDYVPTGFPWTVFATTMTLLATVVLTVSLSYVISVISAAIARRTTASDVRALGGNPVDLARRARLSDPVQSMHTYLETVASAVSGVAERQLAYPVLRYFHSSRLERSASASVLLLADATFLLETGPDADRPGPGLSHVLHSAIDDFADAKSTSGDAGPPDPAGQWLRDCADRMGSATGAGSAFEALLPTYLETRAALVSACENDGWPPSDL